MDGRADERTSRNPKGSVEIMKSMQSRPSKSTVKILFVTTAFYPEQAIGSIRLTKLVKYLDAIGLDVSVVSKHVDDDLPRDETLFFDSLERINWLSVPQSSLFQLLFMRARNKIVKGDSALKLTSQRDGRISVKARVMSYLHFFFTLLKGLDWARQVKKQVQSEMRDQTFDIVIASYPSYGAPIAARALKLKGIARKCIIDFRDPMTYANSEMPLLKTLNRGLQSRLAKTADAAVFVSLGVEMMVTQDSPFPQTFIVTNGYDPDDGLDDAVPVTTTNKLIFCYVGALYGGQRDLSVFFSTVSDLLRSGEVPRGGIEIRYAGKEFEVFLAQALAHGAEELVFNHGLVSRKESMHLQRSADICLVSTWNDAEDQGILTGKIFEYMLFRKPIISIVGGDRPESEMKKVIESTGAGVCVELASTDLDEKREALRSFIKRCYHEKINAGVVNGTYNESVVEYSYPNLANSLRDILILLND